ncbi:MAG: 16S rRNA (adenine(1518)-N(6)/adenine(1519)-N(6))-dimethyltransferase RsmA [Planktomarina sp.]|nr:16S rRNA (adenine(1518)-N(6)/adenine(1519)-N(6))-dimethyltransferase RsmA [Planktomarina sp.]
MQIDTLPPLREVISTHTLNAKKSLGQNFILDLNLTAKIARLAGSLDDHDILEIGPGPGGLTRGLLSEGARRVVVLEKDIRCMPALEEIKAAYPNKVQIFNADALEFDARRHLTGPVRIVSNLPYNVGTELLIRWLAPGDWPPFWETLTLMFQKEVAERIIAAPGSKAYGRLSILAQWKANAKIVLALPPEAFSPPPKVHSAVVHMTALPEPRFPAPAKLLSSTVAMAFNQRRKMLRSSLKSASKDIEMVLRNAGLEPTARAEEISLEGFCALARGLASS